MAQNLEQWTASMAEMAAMQTLAGATIGIEASQFLEHLADLSVPRIQRPIKEALLPALGGLPFGLKSVIHESLKAFAECAITPFFVFSGMAIDDSDSKEFTFTASTQSAVIVQEAWDLYQRGDTSSVQVFQKAASVTAKHFRYLQAILREHGIGFLIAPYGAPAQVRISLANGGLTTNVYASSAGLSFENQSY
jgi:hypothetical protein